MKMKTIKILLCSALLSLGHSTELREELNPTQTERLSELFNEYKSAGYPPIAEYIQAKNINPTGSVRSPDFSLFVPDPDKVFSWVLFGGDVNDARKDPERCTPLLHVSRREFNKDSFDYVSARIMDVVPILLSAGADINATASDGATSLCYALFRKNPPLVDLLLKLGANPALGKLMGRSGAKEWKMLQSPYDNFTREKAKEAYSMVIEAEEAFARKAAEAEEAVKAFKTLAISTQAPSEETKGEEISTTP